MKVFSPGANSGIAPIDGFGVFFQLLWRYLAERGVEVTGSQIESILMSGVFNPLSRFKIPEKISEVDIIHSQDDVGFMLKRKSTPLILSNQLYPFDPVYQRYTDYKQKTYQYLFLKRYMKKSYLVADAVVVPSNWTASSIKSDFPHLNIHVIHNGVDTEAFKSMEVEDPFPGRVKLLFVGNWTKRKGVDLIPKIMDRLGRDFVLMQAGHRWLKDLPDGCEWLKSYGGLPDQSEALVRLYNSCDIFLFPSRLEGFGFAVAEAMACGKPVVATNYSSLPELVVDGRGGYLCEMDNVEEFVARIRQLAVDTSLRKEMGRFNRQRTLEMFEYRRMGEEYLSFYRSFL